MIKHALILTVAVLALAGIAFLPGHAARVIAANAALMAFVFGVAGLLLCRTRKERSDV